MRLYVNEPDIKYSVKSVLLLILSFCKDLWNREMNPMMRYRIRNTFICLQISENPMKEDVVFGLICTYLNLVLQYSNLKY